jgi:chromosome segregation ATPase
MLILPGSREMVSKLLAGDHVDIAIEEDDGNKNLDTLRSELSNVKAELAKSKEALEGLKAQSELLEQTKLSLEALTKENTELKNNFKAIPEGVKEELASVTKKYTEAQATIKLLEEEKAELIKSSKQANQGDNKETDKKLAEISAELKESQELVKVLAEKNKTLQSESLDPKLLEKSQQQLASTHEELEALKVQNQLLREQATNADISEQERRDSNHQFSETIAALNSDIGQLRTRIKELEELEKMKDNHIDELQKSLDHATVVIKEQAEVNKKMYARLNAMEKADKEKEAKQKEDDKAAAVTSSNQTPPADSGNNPAIVNFADKPGTSSTSLAVSETMKHISPKFWLMLTLAGLLFVLALLWRMVSGKDEPEPEVTV